jgi:hypothetical protein
MHKWFIAILIMALLPCSLHGQETELKSTKAKAAVRDYERKIEDVDEDFEKQLKNLEKSYQMKSEILRARLLSNLNAAMEEEAKRVRLEEATEIKELIKQRKETELPTLDTAVIGLPQPKGQHLAGLFGMSSRVRASGSPTSCAAAPGCSVFSIVRSAPELRSTYQTVPVSVVRLPAFH